MEERQCTESSSLQGVDSSFPITPRLPAVRKTSGQVPALRARLDHAGTTAADMIQTSHKNLNDHEQVPTPRL